MDVDSAWGWRFDPNLQSDNDLVRCPECDKWYPLSEWIESSVGCQDCGEHAAMECPADRDHYFDHVWSPTFDVRLYHTTPKK
jgi:hypothetical protein